MTRWPTIDWYDESRAYDIIFDAGTREEADFLEAAFDRYATGPAAVRRGGRAPAALEPACGTGRLVIEMASRGWAVTGYDLSAKAIAYARGRLAEHGLAATLSTGAMQDWRRRRRYDLAFNLVSTFKYLLAEDDAVAHLRHTAAMLRPGGLYLLGLHVTDYADRARHRERWRAERDGVSVTAVIETEPADRRRREEKMRARLTISERGADAKDQRRFETRWTFRAYGPRQLRTLLAAVPELECVAVHDFRYLIDETMPIGGERLDHLLVLRRASGH
jgi:SAM-dependent methyltransferase